MILIKKRNDYYDYLTHVLGVDNNKVLNRRDDLVAEDLYWDDFLNKASRRGRWLWEKDHTYDIFVANRQYRMQQVEKGVFEFLKFHKVNTDLRGNPLSVLESELAEGDGDWVYFVESGFNKEHRRVLSIKDTYSRQWGNKAGLSPILESFGFPRILDAMEVYSEIDMLLGWYVDNPCKIDELDDLSKLEAKGFDKKTSFRHRK